jgi:hypothetical protein
MSVDIYEVTNIPKKGDLLYISPNIIKELRASGSSHSALEDEELYVMSVTLVSIGCFRVSVIKSGTFTLGTGWSVDLDINGFSPLFNSTVFEFRSYDDEEEEEEDDDEREIKTLSSFSMGANNKLSESKYNGRCPYCGHQAYNGLFETKCSNRSCEKYSS